MSDVSGISSPSTLQSISGGPSAPEEEKSNELGQSAFLELMITQLNNQNPLNPQDNSEFVAQLAQFSSVEGLERLNTSMDAMVNSYQSSSALQASALVGRAVMVESEEAPLHEGGAIAGSVNLDGSTSNLMLNIYDADNQLVRQQQMGSQPSGEFDFIWDGSDMDGNTLPVGVYRFEMLAEVDGEQVAQATSLSANVNSVTLGQGGAMTLNLSGIGSVKLSDVKEIL
jgi:flagellar basal-body rod modification protein FlgD